MKPAGQWLWGIQILWINPQSSWAPGECCWLLGKADLKAVATHIKIWGKKEILSRRVVGIDWILWGRWVMLAMGADVVVRVVQWKIQISGIFLYLAVKSWALSGQQGLSGKRGRAKSLWMFDKVIQLQSSSCWWHRESLQDTLWGFILRLGCIQHIGAQSFPVWLGHLSYCKGRAWAGS